MKLFLSLFFGICLLHSGSISAGKKEAGLLFKADFDTWSVNANYAKGNPNCLSFENPDLQLRMFPGIKGKNNGAVCLEGTECCEYELMGNLTPNQGTVSLWVNPQNWKVSDSNWQIFFEAKQKDFRMLIYKYIWPNLLCFYIKFKDSNGEDKVLMARTMLEDIDWPNGKWHKLDVTWDKNGMKLYVDGHVPKVYNKNNQRRIADKQFQISVEFPKEVKNGLITVGMPKASRKNQATNLEAKTAFDEIKIYDRPLSAAEIRKAYEKYFPSNLGKTVEASLVRIPKTDSAIVLDGKIESREWADATLFPVAKYIGDTIPRVMTQVYCKYDKVNLYAGFYANRAPIRYEKTAADGKIWEDDSFEMLLADPRKNIYHFIINSNGALYDECGVDKTWNSNSKVAVKRGENFWSAEFAVPLSAMPDFKAGKNWRGNFCATYYLNREKACFSSWSKTSHSYNDAKAFGDIRIGNDNIAVRLEKIGNLKLGKLDLCLNTVPRSAANSIKLSAVIEQDGTEPIKYPGQLSGNPWIRELPVGKQKLTVTANDKQGNPYFRYDKFYQVNMPLEINYAFWYKRGYMDVRVDLNNSGDANLKALKEKGLSGVVQLISPNDAILKSKQFTARKSVGEMKFKIPDNLVSATYQIKVVIDGVKGKIERSTQFRVPDMTPYKAKVALDHTIPPPWTAVKKLTDKHYQVLDREYFFSNGPFPEQIISKKEKILSSPVKLNLNGHPVQWQNFHVKKVYPDYIILAGTGTSDGLTFSWEGELWYDGAYKIDFSMYPSARNSVTVNALKMSWKMPEKYARFVLSPLLEKWQNNKITLLPTPKTNTAREHIVWLTGRLRGLMWWPESGANWVYDKGVEPIVITRNNNLVHVNMDIISKPAKLTQKADYRMVFTATPTKPLCKNWRSFNNGNPRICAGANNTIGGWSSFYDKPMPGDTTTPASHVPRDPVAYAETAKSSTCVTFPYAMPAQIGTNEAEYDYFSKTWNRIPGHNHRLSKNGVKYMLSPACGHTKVADLFAWRTEQFFLKYPQRPGFYYDVGKSGFCENREHGHGGTDAFGKRYLSSNAWGLRQLLTRIYKVHKKHGKTFFYHSHSHFNPVCHTFSDYFYPGEQYFRAVGNNPEHVYCEEISLDEYQSELNAHIKGVALVFLPQLGRAAKGIEAIKHWEEKFRKEPEWTLRMLTPLLLHDLNVSASWVERKHTIPKWWKIKDSIHLEKAVFEGYWNNTGVKSSSPNILVSVFRWKKPSPYKTLFVVGNLGRKTQPVALDIDKARYKITPNTKFMDLWDNIHLTPEQLKNRPLKGNHFLLIAF